LLEAHGFQTWLVNAKDVKHRPGRPKTDRLDAVWLTKVAERQMLSGQGRIVGPEGHGHATACRISPVSI
jgi:hypothetical protein